MDEDGARVRHHQRLLIIATSQFGYHLDTYYYCKWARADFRITYQGFDHRKPRLDLDGIDVRYVSRRGRRAARYLRFLRACLAACRGDYEVIFLKYFPGCSLVKMRYPRRRFVLDIRTGSVARSPRQRWCKDFLLGLESICFRHVTVISQSLAEKLRLGEPHVLPLGADPIDTPPKRFASLHFLYVGTLEGRRLEDTIVAFHQLYGEAGPSSGMTYDVIGDGHNGEREQLRALVRELGLEGVVFLPGFIHHRDLLPYYEKCNVGISYVPINPIYDCQPPTKTFEYLLAGLPVIATNTRENRSVIGAHNGLLTEDTPAALYEALTTLMRTKDVYCSDRIRADARRYAWQTIVQSNFVPYLHSLADSGSRTL
jgi:glycosyltransferase involved in cell wall biosynthesis